MASNIRWSDELYARVLGLQVAGHSASQIAAIVGPGLSRSAIIGKLDRMKANRPKWQPGVSTRKYIPKAVPVIVPTCEAVDPLHLELTELQEHSCRFPYGDGPFTFCGQHKFGSSSYCVTHHKRTTGASPPRRSNPVYPVRRAA